jgi:hypothetical protein
MNEGLFLGAYKGLIFNAAQLGLVLYPSVFFANRSTENKLFTFATTYTALDALFYPVDSLKNILYADTLGKYCTDLPIQPSKASPIQSPS